MLERRGFENEISAIDFFGLKKVYRYEPAREIDERTSVDCVVCFDVLEHIENDELNKRTS